MAISILNTTTAALTNSSYTVSIPATTAGSTLIVTVTSIAGVGGGLNFPDHVIDSEVSFPSYTKVVDGAVDYSSQHHTCQTHYRTNVAAGITSVLVVPNNSNGMNMWATIFEVAGVNVLSPFEGANLRNTSEGNTTSTSGTALVTAFTNALYIGVAFRSSAQTLTAAGGFTGAGGHVFSSDYTLSASKIASGSNTYTVNHAFGSSAFMIGTASFNPSPNDFTLSLNDSLAVDDTLDDAADYERVVSDSFSLADVVNIVNFSNNQFKNLSDSLSLAESFSKIFSAVSTFAESLTLDDTISFQQNFGSNLTDNIQLTEWMSIKKTNSTRWGN